MDYTRKTQLTQQTISMQSHTAQPIVSLSKLCFSYGVEQVIQSVSFDILPGDFIGLIGQNGSGKTTLLKLMLGLLKPTSGTISIFGKSLTTFREWHNIGYVPQKSHIDSQFPASVLEIVSLGLSKQSHTTSQASQRINQAIAQVELTTVMHKRIGELSGGQQQRVLIAKALVNNPQLLILDEPTTGIDAQAQTQFTQILKKLHQTGITIILVSHDTHTITSLVNKVIHLQGHAHVFDSHDEFCQSPKGHSVQSDDVHTLKVDGVCCHSCKQPKKRQTQKNQVRNNGS
jgi:zinc transport system ATP-binding protein